jgi:hypothetical protein
VAGPDRCMAPLHNATRRLGKKSPPEPENRISSMSQLVESRMGAVAWGPLAITPFPIPAHQTGRADFRHPAFRLASLRSEPLRLGPTAAAATTPTATTFAPAGTVRTERRDAVGLWCLKPMTKSSA